MLRPLLLSVNIDHVATLRQARQAPYPDPVEAASIAEHAGATGITVHLRCDRRHIQDDDVRRLRPRVAGKLNLEISTEAEMVAIACQTRPHQVTLVPERPDEVSTEGGLDVGKHYDAIVKAAEQLVTAGIEVSLFIDPHLDHIDRLARIDRELVGGFEINTDAFAKAAWDHPVEQPPGEALSREIDKIVRASRHGAERGLHVYAGHGLTTANVGHIAAIPEIEELNIGHWLVSRAAMVGMAESVREMLEAMASRRSSNHW